MDWWKLKLYRWMLSLLEEGGTQNPVEWNKPLFLSITLLAALYRRRIPALTMTVARRGTPSARVCGNNQKRCTPGFYRANDSRVCPSCSPVLCGGGRNRTLTQILVGRCYSFLDYPDAIHARAVSDVRHGFQADGSSRWGGLPRGGSVAEKG